MHNGCNIIRNNSDGSYKKFESIFCQQFGISQTKSFIKHLTAKPIQILLVDDQQIVLWGLEKLIESKKPRMEVIGSVTNIDDALLLVEQKQPDVVILNIKLNGADCLHSISSFTRNEHTKVVIFTEIEEGVYDINNPKNKSDLIIDDNNDKSAVRSSNLLVFRYFSLLAAVQFTRLNLALLCLLLTLHLSNLFHGCQLRI